MTQDQANGQWNQIKGRAKKAWEELTDDDFKKAEGSVDKLHGVIQEKFGVTKEAIVATLEALHLKELSTDDVAFERGAGANHSSFW